MVKAAPAVLGLLARPNKVAIRTIFFPKTAVGSKSCSAGVTPRIPQNISIPEYLLQLYSTSIFPFAVLIFL